MSQTRTVLVCPECGSSDVERNMTRGIRPKAGGRYRCKQLDCKAAFDDPDERETTRKRDAKYGLAKRLEEMDPDAI